MARIGWIGSAAMVLLGVASAATAAPSSVPATATPTTATVGVATPVVVSSLITDTTFISANLLRTDATGRSLSVIGTLHDDGLNGDAVAGDRVFSYSVSVSQAATGKVYYRVSAAFRGVLARVLSSVVAIDIVPLKTTPQITLTLTPNPGAGGWSRVPVTAHYTCTPQGSAIVSCPQDQVFSSDGANLVATGSATDATGGTATATSQPFGIDRSVPGITVSLTANLAPGSWTNQSVTAHFTCTDGLSGVASCPQDQTFSAEGGNQVTSGTAVDNAGNQATASAVLNIDLAAPVVTASAAPAANGNGWNSGPVVVTFAVSDALSGVAAGSVTPPVTLASDGVNLSASGQGADLAGNIGSTTLAGINIDQVAPAGTVSLSPASNNSGWNNTAVTAHFTCVDSGSGIAICPPEQVFATDGANQVASGTSTDRAGNATLVTSGAVNIDSTPPQLAIVYPVNGTVVSSSELTVTGAVADALSGVSSVSCNGTPATVNGTNFSCIVQLVEGQNSVAVLVYDGAGNVSTSSVSVLSQLVSVAEKVGATFRSPATAVVDTPTIIDFIVSIFDAGFTQGSAKLLRLSSDGTATPIGQFHDDGQNGDAMAGDKLYTFQLTLTEPSAGQIPFQISADFATSADVRSNFLPVFVQPSNAPDLVLHALSSDLSAGNLVAASRLFLDSDQVSQVFGGVSPLDRSQLAAAFASATLISSSMNRRTYSAKCILSTGPIQFTVVLAPNNLGEWIIIAL